MYPKAKILSEEEYQAWRSRDLDLKRNKRFAISGSPRRNRKFDTEKPRKKQQRDLNYAVRRVNKLDENDYLWRGRFFIRQVDAEWHEYRDHGGYLTVTLRFYDKKDDLYVDYIEGAARLCDTDSRFSAMFAMNHVITKIFKVYPHGDDNFSSPYEDRIDYRSIPNEYTIRNAKELYPVHNYFQIH